MSLGSCRFFFLESDINLRLFIKGFLCYVFFYCKDTRIGTCQTC